MIVNLNSLGCLVMKLALFCVLGPLVCILVLLELPSIHGKYLLVEIESTAATGGSAIEGAAGKTEIECNMFVYTLL